jgi:hypothetical protein
MDNDSVENRSDEATSSTPPYPPIPPDQLAKLMGNEVYTEEDRAVFMRMGRGEISRDEAAALVTQNVKKDSAKRREQS